MKIRRKRPLGLNEPLRHPDHPLPITRRQFLAQGMHQRRCRDGGRLGVQPVRESACGLCRALARHRGAQERALQYRARRRQDSRSSASTWPVARISPAPTCWWARAAASSTSFRPRATASWACPATWCPTPRWARAASSTSSSAWPFTRTAPSCAAFSSAPRSPRAPTSMARCCRRSVRTTPATIRTTRCTASTRPARSATCWR